MLLLLCMLKPNKDCRPRCPKLVPLQPPGFISYLSLSCPASDAKALAAAGRGGLDQGQRVSHDPNAARQDTQSTDQETKWDC